MAANVSDRKQLSWCMENVYGKPHIIVRQTHSWWRIPTLFSAFAETK